MTKVLPIISSILGISIFTCIIISFIVFIVLVIKDDTKRSNKWKSTDV